MISSPAFPLKKHRMMYTYFAAFPVALSSLPPIATAAMSAVEEMELRIRHVNDNKKVK